MCRRVDCQRCGRPGWAGCGAHIEQVLGNVPEEERCHCREEAATPQTQPRRPPPENPPAERSWLGGLLDKWIK